MRITWAITWELHVKYKTRITTNVPRIIINI